MDAVRSKRCVNDQVIAPVLARNQSCFNACPQPTNRSSDCWITCVFSGLLGDDSIGAPPIGSDGSAAAAGALLLRQFTLAMGNDNSTACPQLATNQSVDSGSAQPVGLRTLTLYRLTPPLNGSSAGSSLRNTNSADAAGLTWLVSDHESADIGVAVGATITEANVTVNELFGELTLCADDNSTGEVRCAPEWDCTCQTGEGATPSCQGDEHHGVCECMEWGGCREEDADNSVVVSVGRRKVGAGHVYSTMRGGECDGWNEMCSWRQSGEGRTVEVECLREQLSALSDNTGRIEAELMVRAAFDACAQV